MYFLKYERCHMSTAFYNVVAVGDGLRIELLFKFLFADFGNEFFQLNRLFVDIVHVCTLVRRFAECFRVWKGRIVMPFSVVTLAEFMSMAMFGLYCQILAFAAQTETDITAARPKERRIFFAFT